MTTPENDPKLAKADAQAAKARAKALRPWFKKKRFIAPIVLVALIGFNTAMGGSKSEDTGSKTSQSQTTAPTDSGDSESTETISQQNAREKAESYLSTMAFSRSGLIKQLEFEKFETVDAEYAVDAIDVDWNEQAAKKAQSYLDTMSFSRGSLIDQLVFEGFTDSQATYGVDAVGL